MKCTGHGHKILVHPPLYISSSPFSCFPVTSKAIRKIKGRNALENIEALGTISKVGKYERKQVICFCSGDMGYSTFEVFPDLLSCFMFPSQNNLIRELEHTKKLIEDSHHEKVRDSFSFCTHSLGGFSTLNGLCKCL